VGTTELGGDVTTAGKALLDDADAAAQRSTLGLGTAATASTGDFAATGHAHDHGTLTGLADDDHTQYHTDARALTWLGTRSTTDLPQGTNLYYPSADQSKLAGIASGATANATDAALRARSSHTGTQLMSTISDAGALATLSAVGTSQITDANVTYAKIQNVSAASKLLGRGDSGGGAPQEITLGANLTMTGTTLAATGGSGLTQPQVMARGCGA